MMNNFDTHRDKTNENLKLERKSIDRYLTTSFQEDKDLVSLKQEREATDSSLDDERIGTDHATVIAEKSLANRDNFLAVVSHDLKNPLAAILLSAKVLRKMLKSPHSSGEQVNKSLEVIEQSAMNMDHMIRDLLDVERIKNNQMVFDKRSYELCSLLEEVFDLYTPLTQNKSLTLKFEECTPIFVVLGHDRIYQVLTNLLGNAVKFTPAGGTITLQVQKIENRVEVSVSDTGQGVPNNLKDKIFERFAQTKDRDSRGLGLGLYIAKWIVEEHQGQIWVTDNLNNNGQGSIFTFSLPLPQHIFSA